MQELTLQERFALISLNALDSIHMTTAKKSALRCISAAKVLGAYMDGLWPSAEQLKEKLRSAADLSSKDMKELESTINGDLTGRKLLHEIPNLLACDMNYVTACVDIFEYRCDPEVYTQQIKQMRTNLMEEGNTSDEVICLFWLLRESSCFYDLFPDGEMEHVSARINKLYLDTALAKKLFPVVIHNAFEAFGQKFLKKKKEFFTTQLGTGILFNCPVLERSQSIFIEADQWFSNADKRLDCVLNRLNSQGHAVEVLRTGTVPLLKIDNLFYECVPTQVMAGTSIQGVRLRRYLM